MAQLIAKFLIFIVGASIGSFLNVLIDRLPNDEKITGRSHCDYCKKRLRWYDLIPVVSFFVLGGKCRYCHKKLSWQYPIVEIITGILFLLIFNFQFSPLRSSSFEGQAIFNEFSNLFVLWGIISCLIVIFFSDLKYHLLSDYILLALFVFSFLYRVMPNLFRHPIVVNEILKQVQNDVLSGFIVALPIFLIYYFSHERAMGLGDVYLSVIIGFLLGWKAGFIALYIAFVTGAIFGMTLILLKKKKIKSKIPFGPFIVFGTTVMLFWGEKIMEIIKRIYGL